MGRPVLIGYVALEDYADDFSDWSGYITGPADPTGANKSWERPIQMIEKRAYDKLREALEFYAQKPVPDITSTFAKSAAEWGEGCVTWEPLTDLGEKARAALRSAEETHE